MFEQMQQFEKKKCVEKKYNWQRAALPERGRSVLASQPFFYHQVLSSSTLTDTN